MQRGFEETDRREGGQICRQGVLFGKEIGHLFLRDQPRRGARVKIDTLTWKEVEETQGHMPVIFSVKSPLEGEGGWVLQAGPEDLEQPLVEFIRRLQNKSKKTGELQINSLSGEQSGTLQEKP